MKLGQVIEYNKQKYYSSKIMKETGRLAPDLLLFFKKALYEVKANDLQLSFNHFR